MLAKDSQSTVNQRRSRANPDPYNKVKACNQYKQFASIRHPCINTCPKFPLFQDSALQYKKSPSCIFDNPSRNPSRNNDKADLFSSRADNIKRAEAASGNVKIFHCASHSLIDERAMRARKSSSTRRHAGVKNYFQERNARQQ